MTPTTTLRNFKSITKFSYVGLPLNNREELTANRNYYVRTDGSDDNNGLTDTSGGAFLTIQKAVDVVCNTLDCKSYNVDIRVADGTYTITTPIQLKEFFGTGYVSITGNSSTPANVLLTSSTSRIYELNGVESRWNLQYHKITTSAANTDGIVSSYSHIGLRGLNFGSCTRYMINAFASKIGFNNTPFTISGGAQVFLNLAGSIAAMGGLSITLTGSPIFSLFFVSVTTSYLSVYSFTHTGTTTGQRFYNNLRSVIEGTGGSTTYLPGNTNGSTVNGSFYA
jgi:hypothetical protein